VLCVAGKFHFQYANNNIEAEQNQSIEWVVNVAAQSKPVLTWYGPDCNVLEHVDSSRYEVYKSADRTATRLKIQKVSFEDRGVYRLQARSKSDEAWAYFTLNVTGKNIWFFKVLVLFIAFMQFLICYLILCV
jgi:hypothetical protein